MDAKQHWESAAQLPKKKVLQSRSDFWHSEEHLYYDQQLSRVEEESYEKLLNRSLVALTFLYTNKKISTGSGVLISKNTVLTAAQNIFNKQLNTENTDFKIYVGVNGVTEEYYQVEGWRYPAQFKTCSPASKLPYDYAIIKLTKPVKNYKSLRLALACQKCLLAQNQDNLLTVLGYPCAQPPQGLGDVSSFEDNFKPLDQSGKSMKLYPYIMICEGSITVIEAKNSKIGYRINTLPGQSGCPVVQSYSIIAVHVGGDNAKFNVGRLVDVNFMNSLWKWREELNADPFTLQNKSVCQHVKKTLNQMRYNLDLTWRTLSSVDFREYGNILQLDLHIWALRQIDLSHFPRLYQLDLSENQLQSIDLTNQKHLNYLSLHTNQLQEIDLRANINLVSLNLHTNQLQQIDVKANIDLNYLQLNGNQLREIDVSENINLNVLYLDQNQLRNLDVRANINPTDLSLDQNQLQEIDISANVNLTRLDLSRNKLQEIDVRTNVNLTYLNLLLNELQEIDVRTNVYLTQLNLFSNRITEIDLTKNNELDALNVKSNRLAHVYLSISQNTNEQKYTKTTKYKDQLKFSLVDQQSAACRVQLLCEGQGKAVRERPSGQQIV